MTGERGYVVVCVGVGWAFECVVDGIVHPTHQLHAVTQKVVLRTKRYNVRIYMGGQGYYCSGQSQLSLHLHLVILVLKHAPVAAATSLLSTI